MRSRRVFDPSGIRSPPGPSYAKRDLLFDIGNRPVPGGQSLTLAAEPPGEGDKSSYDEVRQSVRNVGVAVLLVLVLVLDGRGLAAHLDFIGGGLFVIRLLAAAVLDDFGLLSLPFVSSTLKCGWFLVLRMMCS